MKKFVALLLAGCMLFGMTAAAELAAGTYTGVGDGRNGDIQVEVVVNENKIESVAVTAHEETPGISDPALEQIPAAIVEKQSLAVDTVAGATLTSEGILMAVENDG